MKAGRWWRDYGYECNVWLLLLSFDYPASRLMRACGFVAIPYESFIPMDRVALVVEADDLFRGDGCLDGIEVTFRCYNPACCPQ